MTTQEHIAAAIAARPQATPGPLKVVFKGTIGKYTVEKQEGGVHRQLAYCGYFDALLFAAAPDLVDEVVRLRKRQSEAVVKLMAYASKLRTDLNPVFGKSYSDAGVRKEDEEYLADLDRLIAEAQED